MNHAKPVWSAVLVAAFVNAAAYAFDLFDRMYWIDKALHFYTSFAVTLALAYLWRDRLSRPLHAHPIVLVLSLAALGLALGAVWEIGEWLADRISGQDIIKGKTDTILDLILDGAGAALAGLLALPFSRNSERARESVTEPVTTFPGIAVKREPKKPRRSRGPAAGTAGTAGDEASGQIPPGPEPSSSADKARKESGQGPTRGVGEEKERE